MLFSSLETLVELHTSLLIIHFLFCVMGLDKWKLYLPLGLIYRLNVTMFTIRRTVPESGEFSIITQEMTGFLIHMELACYVYAEQILVGILSACTLLFLFKKKHLKFEGK